MTRMRFRVENHLLVENRPPLPGEMPFEVRLLPQAFTQDEIIPWLIINHTQAASRAIPLDDAWKTDVSRSDGIESHLLGAMDGRGMQTMPFNIVAHTSYKANRFFVPGVGYCGQLSVESQDQGGATLNQTPWSPPQFEFLCQAWAAPCVHYGIPVQPVPNAYGRGVSQHNAFPEWSKSAHSCPGVARTQQMPAMRARIEQIIEDDRNTDNPPISDEEDYLMAAIQAIYKPGPAVTRPNPKWFVLRADGGVRHASGPDVEHGNALKVPTYTIGGDEHYDQLDVASQK